MFAEARRFYSSLTGASDVNADDIKIRGNDAYFKVNNRQLSELQERDA